MSVKQKHLQQSSLGISLGILAACLVTVIGAFAGNEPETILFRVLIGGMLVGVLTSTLSKFAQVVLAEQDEEDF